GVQLRLAQSLLERVSIRVVEPVLDLVLAAELLQLRRVTREERCQLGGLPGMPERRKHRHLGDVPEPDDSVADAAPSSRGRRLLRPLRHCYMGLRAARICIAARITAMSRST